MEFKNGMIYRYEKSGAPSLSEISPDLKQPMKDAPPRPDSDDPPRPNSNDPPRSDAEDIPLPDSEVIPRPDAEDPESEDPESEDPESEDSETEDSETEDPSRPRIKNPRFSSDIPDLNQDFLDLHHKIGVLLNVAGDGKEKRRGAILWKKPNKPDQGYLSRPTPVKKRRSW